MQQNDRGAVSRTGFRVANVEEAGIDLFEGGERGVRPRFDCGRRPGFHGLRIGNPNYAELPTRDREGRGAKNAAAAVSQNEKPL